MICGDCKMRWADLPENYRELTKEEEIERMKEFESNEIRRCPVCIIEE